MGTENQILNSHGVPVNLDAKDRNTVEYLAQLLKDKKQIQAFPNVFIHAERLLDEEISKVRVGLFHLNGSNEPLSLPDPQGPLLQLSEKVFVPVKEHPEFNFVGRILGPQGHTIKELEKSTGCRIMVRGRGSMRDKKKEEQYRGKPNWEHLNEELHVLINVEDTKTRAEMKLQRAVEEVRKLLVPAPEGEDNLKKVQLMELALLNGTYRDPAIRAFNPSTHAHTRTFDPATGLMLTPNLRAQGPAGAPLFLSPRGLPGAGSMQTQIAGQMASQLANHQLASAQLANAQAAQAVAANAAHQHTVLGSPPPLVPPISAPELSMSPGAGLIYTSTPYDHYAMTLGGPSTALFEYPGTGQPGGVGAVPKMRTHSVSRAATHPYARVSLS
ncbi:protein quaking-B isoform X2 [Lingula anatina]|uniref:Protein quaking-B isoform X2 n=1 Tax=Lingula anatina TaxID=7574 RepID=A0A1S3JDP3_LINAN|nr:protein quaking-B isoform X2 [Lingula anatina]|eukprot:XP_013408009.1 protein quaking-B isoform X2 [Lingula anatina]